MSLQATPVHTSPVPLAKQLVDLKHNVESGLANRSDVQRLAAQLGTSKLGERLRAYLYSKDIQFLTVTPSQAFKAIIYRQYPVINSPVRWQGSISPSPTLATDAELPVIYSRGTLFLDVLTMYWQDEPIEHYEFEEGRQERVLHAPLTLKWNDVQHDLLCEAANKSFYWPRNQSVPGTLAPWLSLRPQDRTTLATGLKRQGYKLNKFQGIRLIPNQIHTEGIWDLGVCVLSDESVNELSAELGVSMDATQISLWFSDGSYFKGSCISQTLSGLAPGFYGGIKRPHRTKGEAICTAGSVMDSFIYVPWSASLNRQQCDYAELNLPVRAKLPSQETFVKASTGFPAYIQQLNDQLISSAGRIFRKCDVQGYAGKVAVGVTDEDVQFIVRGPDLRPRVQAMAFLFSPALPVHKDIMKVRVEFIQDETIHGNLLQLNVGKQNHSWIARWYIAWAGRDNDGDGIVLTSDPIVLNDAIHCSRIKWFDTTQFKSTADSDMDSEKTAIRVATERIRHFSGKIGIYDKLARRIIREDPELMSWEMRTILTEAVQRSISATKKNSGSDSFEGYGWVMEKLPPKCQDWLFENIHDHIDNVSALVKMVLNPQNGRELVIEAPEYDNLMFALEAVSDEMTDHYIAASEVLALVQTFPKVQYHKIKERGRVLWAKHQADTNSIVIKDVLHFISKSKQLWQSVYTNDPVLNVGFSYENAAMVIRTWAFDLSKRVNSHLLVGAMVTSFSLNLLGHVLDLEDLQHSGFIDGIYLPVATDRKLESGMIGKVGTFAAMLAHPVYLSAIKEAKMYKIEEVYPLTAANWIPRTSSNIKQSTSLIKIAEVK